MKILRVSQYVYPDVTGGMPYHVHALSRDQVELGHDVTVVTVRQHRDDPKRETRDGYEVIRYDPVAAPLGNQFAPGMVRTLKNAGDYDVVHAHSHLYTSTNLAAAVSVVTGTPLAITNHGLYSQSAPERPFRWYLKTLGRWTFNRADVVFCYTETDQERVRELGVSSRIEVVPNGIDTERFSPDGPESELIDASGPVVLFVGRFTEGKRPWLAIEAFGEVLEKYPEAELYLCGDGPLRENLEEQVRELGIDKSVTFLGHVPYDEMPKVYRSGDVLVLPSRAEGVPRTVMEALSTDISVVSTNLPHVRSALGESVFYFSGDDVDEISIRIKEAICSRNTSSVENTFDWQHTVRQTTEFLQAIAENQRGSV